MTNRESHAFPSCYIATRLRFEEDIAALARVPSATAPTAIRWFDDYQLHMTVCYLGWLTRATACALVARVAQCPVAPPERVRLTGQLSIVGDRLTQSLIAPIECTQELAALRRAVEDIVAQVAEDDDSQGHLPTAPFSPHVTLGRVSPDLSDASAWVISPAAAASGGLELRRGSSHGRRPSEFRRRTATCSLPCLRRDTMMDTAQAEVDALATAQSWVWELVDSCAAAVVTSPELTTKVVYAAQMHRWVEVPALGGAATNGAAGAARGGTAPGPC